MQMSKGKYKKVRHTPITLTNDGRSHACHRSTFSSCKKSLDAKCHLNQLEHHPSGGWTRVCVVLMRFYRYVHHVSRLISLGNIFHISGPRPHWQYFRIAQWVTVSSCTVVKRWLLYEHLTNCCAQALNCRVICCTVIRLSTVKMQGSRPMTSTDFSTR